MDFLANLLVDALGKTWVSLTHNWPFLLASVLISVGLKLYIRPEKVSAFLMRYSKLGVLGATAAAVTTPFCSCGTTAVVLGMIASTIPWAPVVAFMVASPLTSPEELVYSAGLFGWPFAIAFFLSSILLGLLGGALAEFFQARGWLANQARFDMQSKAAEPAVPATAVAASTAGCACNAPREPVESLAAASCGCGASISAPAVSPAPGAAFTAGCGCSSAQPAPLAVSPRVSARQWSDELSQTGGKLLLMFLGFAFLGYFLNGLIPAAWVAAVFGKGNLYSVPLAATLGLPLYINSEGSLPLVRALLDGGMSQGAALAFLITGAGTSIGAVGGALTIARWRVIALVVGTLWVGAIVMGYAYNLLLAAHLF